MTDPQWRVVAQWRNHLAEVLTAIAGPLAEATPRQPLEAATPEQVDLTWALKVLGRVCQDFAADEIANPATPQEWSNLGDALGRAARLCEQQAQRRVVVEGEEPVVEPPRRPFSASGP